jgi:phenylalanyl-tRNA synthetase beta chain
LAQACTEKGIEAKDVIDDLQGVLYVDEKRHSLDDMTLAHLADHIVDTHHKYVRDETPLINQYLKKVSGKTYQTASVKNILESLDFTVLHESNEAITLAVPHHKRDVSLAADIVEEILRIDGLDNIEIPSAITITPSIEDNYKVDAFKEKVANALVGLGYNEILTNSITNSKYFGDEQRANAINLLNNLSSELDILRPAMLPTALEVIQFNNNRKNTNLRFFEWGKTYRKEDVGNYLEKNHFCIYITGTSTEAGWKVKTTPVDIYNIKGITERVLKTIGLQASFEQVENDAQLENKMNVLVKGKSIGCLGKVALKTTNAFDIKQAVFFANLNWDAIIEEGLKTKIQYKEVSKYPSVERDLALVDPKNMMYDELKNNIIKLRLGKLQDVRLFDIFESDKLGKDKKSVAINFTFLDEEKTLTDKEIDGWMNKIMTTLEKEAGAEIRK